MLFPAMRRPKSSSLLIGISISTALRYEESVGPSIEIAGQAAGAQEGNKENNRERFTCRPHRS